MMTRTPKVKTAFEVNEAVNLCQEFAQFVGNALERLTIIDLRALPGYVVRFHGLCRPERGRAG